MDHLLLLFICSLLSTGVSGVLNPWMYALGTAVVTENDILTVSCEYSSDLPCKNVSLVWRINGHSNAITVESCDSISLPSPDSYGASYHSNLEENGIRNYFYSWTSAALTRAEHGQWWQCEARARTDLFQVQVNRSDVTFISVEGVSGADRLLMHPRPATTVTENDILTLTCLYTTNLTSAEFTLEWQIDGAPFATTVGCHNTTDFIPLGYIGDICQEFGSETYTYTLTTAPTRADHGQTWECVVRTTRNNQSQHSDVTTVTVKVPISKVTITSPPETIVRIEENTEKEFVCETAPGRPETFFIGWFLYTGPKINSMVSWLPTSSNSNWTRLAGDPLSTRIGRDRLIITTGNLRLKPSRAVNGWKIFCVASNTEHELFYQLSPELKTSDDKFLDVYENSN